MKKQPSIQIPKPCTLNWDEMIPSEKGKYCLNCKTEVVDFSSWTDLQIKEFVQNSNKKICGRLPVFNLHDPVTTLKSAPRFAFLAFLGLTSIFSIINGQSVKHQQNFKLMQKNNLLGVEQSNQYKITGRILSPIDQNPLVGVKVFTDKPWLLATVTDSLGVFELIIDKKPLKFVELTIVYPEMSAIIKRVTFDKSQFINMGNLTMQKQQGNLDFIIGEVIVTPFPPTPVAPKK
jgi:hypothetical protein